MNQKGFLGIVIVIVLLVAIGAALFGAFNQQPSGGGESEPPLGGSGTGTAVQEEPEEPQEPEVAPEEVLLSCASGAENVPRVLYSWKWSDVGIDSCDAGDENFVYCDATQFNISLAKKLHAYFDDPTESHRQAVEGFEVYLMKDIFNNDARDDFVTYYKDIGGFFETPAWFKEEDGLWETFKGIEFSGLLTIPGKYEVTVENLPSSDELPLELNSVQGCRQDSAGCKNWVKAQTCGDGRACTAGQCSAIVNNCDGLPENSARCTPSRGPDATLEKCLFNEETQTLSWHLTVCEQAVCDEGDEGNLECIEVTDGTCASDEAGERRCAQVEGINVVQQCEIVDDGQEWKKDWLQSEVCDNGCSGGQCTETAQTQETFSKTGSSISLQGTSSVPVKIYVTWAFNDSRNFLQSYPIEGASVSFTSESSTYPGGTTDAQGFSQDVNLAPGQEFTATVTMDGYQARENVSLQVPANATIGHNFGINLTPNETATVFVSVADGQNNAINGAEVVLSGRGITVTAQTDIIEGEGGVTDSMILPAGTYSLIVSKEGYSEFNEPQVVITAESEDIGVTMGAEEPGSCGSCASEQTGARRCALPITVKFRLKQKSGESNPFYYLPLNGGVGEKAGGFERGSYGVKFRVDAGDSFSFSPEFKVDDSKNGLGGAFPTTISFKDTLQEFSRSAGRGNLLEIEAGKSSRNRSFSFSPSILTPLAMEIDTGKIENYNSLESFKTHYSLRLQEGVSLEGANRNIVWQTVRGCFDPNGERKSFLDLGTAEQNIGNYYITFNLAAGNEETRALRERNLRSKIALQGALFSPAQADARTLQFDKIEAGESETSEGVRLFAPEGQAGTSLVLSGVAGMQLNNNTDFVEKVQDVFTLIENGDACLQIIEKGDTISAVVKWKKDAVIAQALEEELQSLRSTCLAESSVNCAGLENSCESYEEGSARCMEGSSRLLQRCVADEEQGGCLVWKTLSCPASKACSAVADTIQCVEE